MMSTTSAVQTIEFSPQSLGLTVDWVLQGQGMDAQRVRQRRPALVELAEQVLAEGLPLLWPRAALKTLAVKEIRHQQILLEEQIVLSGPAVMEHLIPAQQVTVMAFTIGPAIEERVFQLESEDKVRAFAWDGLANAAVDALGGMVYHAIEERFLPAGRQLSLVLSPGMAGWSVEDGQPQVAQILDLSPIGVEFTPEWVMLPRKSSTALVGAGENMLDKSKLPCDYCTMQGVCRYRGQLAHGSYASSG